MNSALRNKALKRSFATAIYNKVKLTPDTKQKKIERYSIVEEWK